MEENVQEYSEEVGLFGRLARVFYAPVEAFEAVVGRHTWLDWVVPTVIVALVSLASVQMSMPIIEKMAQQAIQERMGQDRQMTAQEEEMIEKMGEMTRILPLITTPIIIFAMLFVVSGVFLLVSRVLLGGEVNYGQMLVVGGYSYMIILAQIVVLTPLRLAKESMMVTLGPGLLIPDEMAQTFLGRLLGAMDIFALWQVYVAAIGLAVMTRASIQKVLGILLVLWLIWVAITIQYRSLFS